MERKRKYPPGVSHSGRPNLSKPFTASLIVAGRIVRLGYFATPDEAHQAYVVARANAPRAEPKSPRAPVARDRLSADRLRQLLEYDAASGLFVWRVSKRSARGAGVVTAGDRAGTLHGGYAHIGIDGVVYPAHRLAWLFVHGVFPDGEIDHIDRNRSNNSISNLRVASRKQNNANTGVSRNNKCGHKGVCFEKRRRTWRATISVNGKQQYLGTYKNMDDAIAAYRRAEISIHGDFAHSKSCMPHIESQHIHRPDAPP